MAAAATVTTTSTPQLQQPAMRRSCEKKSQQIWRIGTFWMRNSETKIYHFVTTVLLLLVVRTFSSYALFETHLLFLLLNRSFRMDPYGNMRLSRRHFTKSQIRKKERENVAEEGVREKTDWDWIKNATNMLWNDGINGNQSSCMPIKCNMRSVQTSDDKRCIIADTFVLLRALLLHIWAYLHTHTHI